MEQDIAEIIALIRQAAEQGDAEACHLLAEGYLAGKGVVGNRKTAYSWALVALALGLEEACRTKKMLEGRLPPEALIAAQDEAQRKHEEILRRGVAEPSETQVEAKRTYEEILKRGKPARQQPIYRNTKRRFHN